MEARNLRERMIDKIDRRMEAIMYKGSPENFTGEYSLLGDQLYFLENGGDIDEMPRQDN